MKIMFIGKIGSGKTTLCQILHDEEVIEKKTQSLEFFDYAVDTPGEYSENRMYYKALIVTSADVDTIAFVQSTEQNECIYPPGFATLFTKKTIGIVTKTDLYPKNIKNAEECLKLAGLKKIYRVNSKDIDSIRRLEKYLYSS
jgi:ethanolamine utilization protein EutP